MADIEQLITDFEEFITQSGCTLPYTPAARIVTAPFLIKWDAPSKSVILPYWEELNIEQKELFIRWRGANAEEFFVSLFNWFFVPHEPGHFMLLTNLKKMHRLKF